MHELGVICQVLSTLESVMEQEKLTHVEQITLQVGELSGMVPDYIKECFPAAVYKTKFEDLKLELEVIPGNARCGHCGEIFNVVKCDLKCPKCGALDNMEPLSGTEFMIKEILAY